jgi:hypothetical protein
MEHYRLHMVEKWPHSLRKEATLAAIHSTLSSLDQNWRSATGQACVVCSSEPRGVLEFPEASRVGPAREDSTRTRSRRVRATGAGASSA